MNKEYKRMLNDDIKSYIQMAVMLLFFPITMLLFFIRELRNRDITVFKENWKFYLFLLTVWTSFFASFGLIVYLIVKL